MEVEADASVESLKHRALTALAVRRGRLLNSSGEVLDGTQTVTQAKLMSGDVLTLHVTNQVQVKAARQGSMFAVLFGDGSVVSCGDARDGGDSSAIQNQLRDVQQIQASDHAFAAILGSVQQIQATYGAFAAILGDGSVVTWGNAYAGGDSSTVQDQLRDVQQIQASMSAFAAILHDGFVVTWGDAFFGRDSSAIQNRLRDVQQIQASDHAFAAILGDGSVVTWGNAYAGGDSSAVQDQLRDVQQIQACTDAFAAILGDGSVVTWGNADYGGDSSTVQDQLRDVQQIQASSCAFAAILGDGSVVTWGSAGYGSDSNVLQDRLRDVQQIQASMGAFAATFSGGGSVVTWGKAEYGGGCSVVQDQLRDMYCYGANRRAERPVRLVFSGIARGSKTHAGLSKQSGYDAWEVQKLEGEYDKLVYLTADAQKVLHSFDPEKVYVIGGIVDRNRLKGRTLEKAQTQGIAAEQLPLSEHIEMGSYSRVLTVNHVLNMILDYQATNDWRGVCERCVPGRKVMTTEGEVADVEDVPGKGEPVSLE
eukprot:s1668_g2.t1